MCGRYTLKSKPETIQEEFKLDSVPQDLTPRYNIAPTQPVAVVVVDEEGHRQMDAFHWGLIPFWAKEKGIGNRMINARSETLAEKSSFKRPLQKQRCLVIADGFYEWQKTPDGKVPMYIQLEDEKPFAFAGLWDRWRSPEEEMIYSCTIVTTTPNSLMESIHNRMPVILTPKAIDIWLNPAEADPAQLLPLLQPYPAEAMHAYAVSKKVNSPANESAECIVPI